MADVHRFEPEFDGPPPREVPAEVLAGPYGRGRRTAVLAVLLAGVVCLALSLVPVVNRWGLFFLPLAYLDWIGLGLIAVALTIFVRNLISPGSFRYITDGVPLAGRILAIELRPVAHHNGQPTSYAYVAAVAFVHPDTGEPAEAEVSSEVLHAAFKDNWDVTYRVGDDATLVYLPDRLEKTLRLYGFLRLRPDLGLVRKREREPVNPVLNVLKIAAVVVVFPSMVWFLYALNRYRPTDFTLDQGVIAGVGALVIGTAMMAMLRLDHAATAAKVKARNARAAAEGRAVEVLPDARPFGPWWLGVVIGLGAMLLGGIGVIGFAWTLNAWLDASPSAPRPVAITEMNQTTHKLLIRTYEIKYRFRDDPAGEIKDYGSTPDEMAKFVVPLGTADVRAGAFGWPWLKTIDPAVPLGKLPPGAVPVPEPED